MLVVERALEAANLRRENRQLRTQAIVPDGLVGGSPAAQQLREMIGRVAPANSRVLISGPPGSGKEMAARLIHAASPRARNEFVAISAAGMSPERMDRELFGEEGGPGRPGHVGVFERAHGGTLYIDDVADMPRETQAWNCVLVEGNLALRYEPCSGPPRCPYSSAASGVAPAGAGPNRWWYR